MIILKDLPTTDERRNKPLAELGVWYKTPVEKKGRAVFSSFGIAKKTYNELAPVWTDNEIFYIPE
jgi:hypothetical protein